METERTPADPVMKKKRVRIFNCNRCRHKVRFGTEHCSACGWPTPFLNRMDIWAVLMLFVAGFVVWKLAV